MAMATTTAGRERWKSLVLKSAGTISVLAVAGILYTFHTRKNQGRLTYDKNKKSNDHPKQNQVVAKVTQVIIYPIKSCRGVSVSSADLHRTGFLLDRAFMIVTSRGTLINQRMNASLTQFEVQIDGKYLVISVAEQDQIQNQNQSLQFERPATYRFDMTTQEETSMEHRSIDILGLSSNCRDCGDHVSQWFNQAMSYIKQKKVTNLRLVAKVKGEVRKVKDQPGRIFLDHYRSDDVVDLHSLAPLHIMSSTSFSALKEKSGDTETTMSCFRPNIVIQMNNPNHAFIEDLIHRLRVVSENSFVDITSYGLTPRCIITTIDQVTGETRFRRDGVRHAEPMKTLKAMRTVSLRQSLAGLLPITMGGTHGLSACLGIYATPEGDTISQVQVGDDVMILDYNQLGSPVFEVVRKISQLIQDFFN